MGKNVIKIFVIILILALILGVVCFFVLNKDKINEIGKKIANNIEKSNNLEDDWKYEVKENLEDILYESSASVSKGASNVMYESSISGDSNLGFTVGGAQNVANYRENIKNGYLPISTDLTFNGLFSDYYFNTGKNNNESNNSNEMFYPTYSTAISKDPYSGLGEYYMTVGLNSNIKESDFQRKKLNLVVVMDISGSMSSSFNRYYYDKNNKNEEKNVDNRSKMTIANESLNCLIDQLKKEDRLGIVLFDNSAYLAKPVNLVGKTDIEKIKEHVLEITPQGGTNFEAGYTKGTDLFTEEMLNNDDYENRIIVITDAMPNLGNTSKNGLAQYVEANANKGIYTTFVGVGVDFNTEVIECLSNVKGANYYSVHNSDEFKKIMGDEFEFMVTPLVFDLELKFDSNEFEIEQVYGTDAKDKSSGTIMRVNTLFPSSSNADGEVKGGIILIKLQPLMYTMEYTGPIDYETKIKVSYKDRDGKVHVNEQKVSFGDLTKDYYDNTGIRKAIVLTRYANVMKNWILYERAIACKNALDVEKDKFLIKNETGIMDYQYTSEDVRRILGENERTSQKINVSKEYKEIFTKLKDYMKKEIQEIGDSEMNQELDILDLVN